MHTPYPLHPALSHSLLYALSEFLMPCVICCGHAIQPHGCYDASRSPAKNYGLVEEWEGRWKEGYGVQWTRDRTEMMWGTSDMSN